MYSEYDATADSSVVNRIRLLIRPKILLIRKSKCFVCFLCIRHYNVAFLRHKFVAAFDHKILATILICFIFMRLLPSCTGGKYCDKPVCKLCLSVCLSVCEDISKNNCPNLIMWVWLVLFLLHSSPGGVAICYVLPVLWTTQRLPITCNAKATITAHIRKVTRQRAPPYRE